MTVLERHLCGLARVMLTPSVLRREVCLRLLAAVCCSHNMCVAECESGWVRSLTGCITWDVPCLDSCIGRPGMALCLRIKKGILLNSPDFCLGIIENREAFIRFLERKLLITMVLLFFTLFTPGLSL